MKKGWEIKTLGEVCEILNGDRGKNYPAKRKLHDSGEYPFISAINFKNKTINIEGLLYLDESQYNALSQGKLKKNDVVLCIRGSLGKNCIFPFDKGAIASSLVILRAQKRVDFNFLSKYLDTNSFFEQIEQQSNGAAQPNLGANKLKTFKIILPPLSEQRRIVEVLDREFERIDTIRKNAETSLQYAKDLMQAKLKEELQYKEGWERKRLGEIIQLLSGQDFPPQKYNDNGEGIPYITGASNFCANGIKINRWTKEPTVLAKQNDILLVVKGSGYGKTMFADFEQAHIARQIMSLRINSDLIKNEYLYYFINSENDYLRDCGVGVIPGISRHNVLDLKISFPPLHEQRQIVSRLDRYSEICKKIEENSKAIITHCDALKQAFLRKAFDGELLS